MLTLSHQKTPRMLPREYLGPYCLLIYAPRRGPREAHLYTSEWYASRIERSVQEREGTIHARIAGVNEDFLRQCERALVVHRKKRDLELSDLLDRP